MTRKLNVVGLTGGIASGKSTVARWLREEGFPVIDGDDTDVRFMDPVGVWVGLSPKGKAKKDKSGFVIR